MMHSSPRWQRHLVHKVITELGQDPYGACGVDWDAVEEEQVLVHEYRPFLPAMRLASVHTPIPLSHTDTSSSDDVDEWITTQQRVKMQKEPFGKGSMRSCYRLKIQTDFSNGDWSRSSACVAKRYTRAPDEDVNRALVENDVRVQMLAKAYAQRFNQLSPPKRIDVVHVLLIEFPNRFGRPYFCVERYLGGSYVKYNSNVGYADERRYTPQAFSHFSFEYSLGRHLVVDIQGVDDLYTDPQIHSIQASDDFGEGNLGMSGFAHFFHTHRCNSVCRWLDLRPFDHYPFQVAPAVPLMQDGKKEMGQIEQRLQDRMGAGLAKTQCRRSLGPLKVTRRLDRPASTGAPLTPTGPLGPLGPSGSLGLMDTSNLSIPLRWERLVQELQDLHISIPQMELKQKVQHLLPELQSYVQSLRPSPPHQLDLYHSRNPTNESIPQAPLDSPSTSHQGSLVDAPNQLSRQLLRQQHLDEVLGKVHLRIAQHFIDGDWIFDRPLSQGDAELEAIVLFHYKQAAALHDVDAQLALSRWYAGEEVNGWAKVKHVDQQLSWVYAKQAADQGSVPAALLLAQDLSQSIRKGQDDDENEEKSKRKRQQDFGKREEEFEAWMDKEKYKWAVHYFELALKEQQQQQEWEDDGTEDETTHRQKPEEIMVHEVKASMAQLYAKGGYGLDRDVNKAFTLYEEAAVAAEASGLGKQAMVYYALAESLE